MGAQSARPLGDAWRDSDGTIFVETLRNDGSVIATQPVTDLPRPELIRVLARSKAGSPKTADGRWLGNEEILELVVDHFAGKPAYEAVSLRREADLQPAPFAPVPDVETAPTITMPVIDVHTADTNGHTVTQATPSADAAALQALRNLIGGTDHEAIARTVDERITFHTSSVIQATSQAMAVVSSLAESFGPSIVTAAENAALAAVESLRPVEIHLAGREVRTIDRSTHKMLAPTLRALAAGCHVMLVGPAGTGKSRIAQDAADGLGSPFFSISVHPQLPASQLFGFIDATGNYRTTPFREAYESGGVFCADELDNGHPGILAALNQALAGSECAFADGMVKRHDDFLMVGTANTFGTGPNAQYVGRQALDAATLDRFIQLEVPVDEDLEDSLVRAHLNTSEADVWLTIVRRMRANVEREGLRIVVSPRCAIDGARLLAAGFTAREAADAKVLARVPAEQCRKVIDGVLF